MSKQYGKKTNIKTGQPLTKRSSWHKGCGSSPCICDLKKLGKQAAS